VAAKMNKAVDEVRAHEAKALKAKGIAPVLKNTRWCLLKRPVPSDNYFSLVATITLPDPE